MGIVNSQMVLSKYLQEIGQKEIYRTLLLNVIAYDNKNGRGRKQRRRESEGERDKRDRRSEDLIGRDDSTSIFSVARGFEQMKESLAESGTDVP
ncbi:hypothetical protein K0M31_018332 [Melipona bicolor]|uniref:Uncharacterized protein n=1 Tax=Melipona bicolor TaxID=60889 RepID=A0AA40KRU1_9HYME|nr:hypothetical protein K0M31_018332 [Melipona bicolor]